MAFLTLRRVKHKIRFLLTLQCVVGTRTDPHALRGIVREVTQGVMHLLREIRTGVRVRNNTAAAAVAELTLHLVTLHG